MAQATEPVVGGGGPGGSYAQLKHWIWVLGLLIVSTSSIMVALVAYWPRCEEQACPGTPCPTDAASTRAAPAASPPSAAGGAAADAPAAEPTESPEAFAIDVLAPTSGPTFGRTSVTLGFSGLAPGDRPEVRFGGVKASVSGAAPNSIVAVTPAHWEGVVDVTAVRPDGSTAKLTGGFNYRCQDRTQGRLLLLVVLAGALGGSLHGLRSLFYFIGNRNLRLSWLPMYFVLPVSGAAISTVFFLVFVGGLFEPTGGDGHNYFLMVGVSALVGMFSQQAVEKLKKISEAILTATQPSADSDGETSEPILRDVVPTQGVVAGGESVKLAGSGFRPGLTVKFDDHDATVQAIAPNEVTVLTPPHAAGAAVIEVRNTDGTKATKPDGFEYVGDDAKG